ncbi:LysR substrate-binding domain-containing protein [Photobacterium sp. SDRW27]|uniref:LysR substrate-binding domain-containing protein n=1 Tax=Photobacterium obscurum TaxID=2829490 RepID=UPI0022447DA9|nr:LysR substrate-binding domain-containing protein [Photobacterium obscurum]MCW8328851.1 LysR substrate-binding domain-containing protein [Photobacterium obscurum]
MRKLIPLKSIYAFVAVAETGSMTEAADVLSVSHSAVSQAIKALEGQLNLPLFRRVGRRVELNHEGRKYYRKVAPALTQIVEASESLVREGQGNRLTLNMVNSLALHWWIPRVSDFQQQAPHIDIRISNLIQTFDLDREGVDVALLHGKPDEWQDYYCEKLGDDELIMVCSPSLLESDGDTMPEQLLAKYPAIFATNPRRKNDWHVWCQANQMTVPSQQKNLTFTASIQAVQATIRRLGVLITHKQFVKDDIKHGMLVQVGKAVLNPYQEFYFVCTADKLKLESVLTLRNWLKGEFVKS